MSNQDLEKWAQELRELASRPLTKEESDKNRAFLTRLYSKYRGPKRAS